MFESILQKPFLQLIQLKMSFALPKAEKLSIFDCQKQVPGPGQYNLNNVNIRQLAAPFNTSKPKISSFDCEETKYGPGYYQAVNIKKLYETKRTLNETSAFASKVKRFKTAPDEIIPSHKIEVQQERSTYAKTITEETKQRCKDRMNNLRTYNRLNRVQSIKNNKQFVRVILTVPGNSENPQSIYLMKDARQQSNGPTSYQTNDSLIKKKCLSLADWNKNNQPRFNKDKNFTPGPGAYQVQANKKNKQGSAAFCYSGMRSHMDSIIYKTNIPLKATLLEQNKVKSLEPGPGHYKNVSTTKKSFHKGNQKFGTKSKRFKTQKRNENEPGPGQYDYNASEIISSKMEFRNTLKDIRKQLFKKNQTDIKRNEKMISKSLIISDNNYIPQQGLRNTGKNVLLEKDQICNLKQRCCSKFGDMSQQPRFKSNSNKHYAPGPGSYDSTAAQGQSSQHSHMFASVSDRVVFNNQNDTPFYNVGAHDISSKINKMKKHIDNLKKINIQQAPFASTTKRFEAKSKEIDEPKIQEIQHFVKKERINYTKKKNMDGTNSFKSKSLRKVFVAQERPGPGDYDYQNQLEKKSFNKNYNYDKLNIHSHIRSQIDQ